MNGAWWRTPDELDGAQRDFIELPFDGRYLLVGPPGSGKTNLLLLRMQYFAGRGEKNLLFITFTSNLRDFIRQGLGTAGIVPGQLVQTYQSWAYNHVLSYGNADDLPERSLSFDEARGRLLLAVTAAQSGLPASKIYDAIFVDEVQDLTVGELTVLLSLSDRVCVSGDGNQGIFGKDGLEVESVLGLERKQLRHHYRIGPKIARVADRLIRPESRQPGLEETCNYNPLGGKASSAALHHLRDRDEQFEKMVEKLRIEVDAFPGELLGVLCAKNETLSDLQNRFDETSLRNRVVIHAAGQSHGFVSPGPIHVLTIHSAKGAEFRTVHLFGAEDLGRYPFNRTRLAFTAVTRAKTALNVYSSGLTSPALESALTEEVDFDWRDGLLGADGA